jgi:hypothetical protein
MRRRYSVRGLGLDQLADEFVFCAADFKLSSLAQKLEGIHGHMLVPY